MLQSILRSGAILLLFAGSCHAADWLRFTSAHFELYTDGDEKRARDLIQYFEQIRGFFLQVTPTHLSEDFPVRLIVFQNTTEYAPYSPRAMTGAYYVRSPKRDYIVLGDLSAETYKSAVHEYTHLIVRHSGLRIPVWLNEGWADVYSSLHPVKGGVAVGDLLPARMKPLEDGPWLDFETLTSVTPQSPIYNEGDRTGLFYGESWALAHMLFLAPDYKQNFAKFVTALHRGSSAAEACQLAYGKTGAQVYSDLKLYLSRKKLYGAMFDTKLTKAETEPNLTRVSPTDSRLTLADLLVALGRVDQAMAQYTSLEQTEPDNPNLAQAIGFAALAKQDIPLALRSFSKAFDAGSDDPQMCAILAQMMVVNHQPPSVAIPVLERALKVKPDFLEAQTQLGFLRVADKQFEAGVAALSKLPTVTPERAPAVFITLSYAYLQTGDLRQARENIESAKKWVKSAEDIQRLGSLENLVAAREKLPSPPTPGEKLQSIEGTVDTIDCAKEGNRLVMQAGLRRVSLLLPDPKAIEFTFAGGKSLQIKCGSQPQPFKVKIDYAPVSVMEQGVAGVIRRLDY